MRATLDQIRQNIRVQKNPKSYSFYIYWEELSRLDKMVKIHDMDLQSFRKLLFEETLTRSPSTAGARTKRGLIDLLRYGMKYLFGNDDARDVKSYLES